MMEFLRLSMGLGLCLFDFLQFWPVSDSKIRLCVALIMCMFFFSGRVLEGIFFLGEG